MFKLFKAILQKAGQYSALALTAAIQNSGIAALYLGTSTLLAAILTAAYLTYAWDIDSTKVYRAVATLQGSDLSAIRQSERDAAAQISYDAMIAERAKRLREDEFRRDVTQRAASLQLPPEDPKPQPPPPPSAAERIDAYKKRIADDLAQSEAAGLDEQTRLIANMVPDQAKEVIRKLWKDGANKRVVQMLTAMEEKERERILYAMRESNDEELKDLCEILQRIGDGEPMRSVIQKAAEEP